MLLYASSPKVSDGELATNAEAEKAGALTAALGGCLTQNKGAPAAVAQKQRLCNVPCLRPVKEAGRVNERWRFGVDEGRRHLSSLCYVVQRVSDEIRTLQVGGKSLSWKTVEGSEFQILSLFCS